MLRGAHCGALPRISQYRGRKSGVALISARRDDGFMATMQPKQPFVTDIEAIRKRARQHMEKGAVTAGYKADVDTVVRVLNEALATEIVCVLRYKRHHFMAKGLNAQSVADEFAEHANEEQE